MEVEKMFYTVKEVVEITGLSMPTVLKLLKEGEIPSKRLGRTWLIPIKFFEEN